VLLTTGYSQEMELIESLLTSGAQLLQKPYSTKALAAKVREVLDRRAHGQEETPS
jgi:DNA-binding response OmpR family regulator